MNTYLFLSDMISLETLVERQYRYDCYVYAF